MDSKSAGVGFLLGVAGTVTALAVVRAVRRDRLPGGRADRYRSKDFSPAALRRGTAVEMEHTRDPRLAREIAMDHLVEDPRYYEKLATIHTD